MPDAFEREAFPSLVPVIRNGDFILEEGFTDGIRRLRVAISTGFGPIWDQQPPRRRFLAKAVASLSLTEHEHPALRFGDLVVEQADVLLHIGSEAIDAWCRDPVPDREADAVRVFRLITFLNASARDIPSLVGIVYRKRTHVVQRIEEAICSAPRDRLTLPDGPASVSRLRNLLQDARRLGLGHMQLVKDLAGVLDPA